ncbi:Protein of unknown function (DUF1644 [Striga hermonthica]|uniref:Uncharacterized protein n=1 Tax=Striga hermonthica TaxID=68872 RepID=A0A9N7NA77_STRHE|nr:Protein of unknown function (DUF1644 [Striga hermonthica]
MAKSKNRHEKYSSNSKHPSFGPTKANKRAQAQAQGQPPLETREYENAICSVCMEFPHNAVLLLCSSHEKGCRPFMCATSHRHSNCLEQYKKAAAAAYSSSVGPTSPPELSCPLCRGAVKGWTVVGPARCHLDAKRRSCTKDGCPFRGNYRELRRHAKTEHPLVCPREVDPARAARWERLEDERAVEDVLSTIRSSMPGAVVVGDYVIERDYYRGGFHGPPGGRARVEQRVGFLAARRTGRLRGQATDLQI